MAKDEQVQGQEAQPGVVNADTIRAKALAKITKSQREQLDGKVEANLRKRREHEVAIKQLDATINADIDAFLAGVI